MEPELNIGDIVVSKTVQEDNLNVGDIISFKENNSVVTHRIIDIKQNNNKKEYITKGDNNNAQDVEPTSYEKIEGKCIFKIPKLGNLTLILNNKILMLIIMIAIIFIIARNGTLRERREIRQIKREEYEKRRIDI